MLEKNCLHSFVYAKETTRLAGTTYWSICRHCRLKEEGIPADKVSEARDIGGIECLK